MKGNEMEIRVEGIVKIPPPGSISVPLMQEKMIVSNRLKKQHRKCVIFSEELARKKQAVIFISEKL